jgi:hypothetical protein
MTEQDLRELLERMYNISVYSDEHISKEQYEYYIAILDTAKNKSCVKEVIREIIFELDITLPGIGRKIAYPFSFNTEVIAWMRSQIKDGEYYCVACGCWHKYQHDDVSRALSIDHEPSLSKRFNDGEYKLSREERYASYNDISRLQIMCQSQNSSKGGVAYDKDKLMKVFLREL